MNADAPTRDQGATSRGRVKPTPWHYAYFLLAAFDLVTVFAGLYLTHRIMSIYTRSVEVNHVWAKRVAAYSQLGALAAAVDTPGNDVFDSRDVTRESAAMRAAEQAFDLNLKQQREELETGLEPQVAAPLLVLLDVVARAKMDMVAEAEKIFDYFRRERPDLAGARMATMDRKFAHLNAELLTLRNAVAAIQDQNFKEQWTAAAEIQRYEYLIGALIILMILGAIFYGHKVAQQIQMQAETDARAQADLQSLFTMAPDGVVVAGPNGRVLTANARAQQLFGYSPQELLGLQLEALMPDNRESSHAERRETWPRASVARLVSPIQELHGVRRDGSEFAAEIVLGPLQFKNEACTIAIVRDITERKKLERERAEQEQRFRDLSRRLVEVQETERRRLSRELHDRTSPNLAAIRINLKMLDDLLSVAGTADVRALLDDTAALIAETTTSIREISSDLRPTVLDDGGLVPAVTGYAQQFMKRTGIAVQVEAEESRGPLRPAVQSSLFRIVQEALTNCAKHAKATRATIRLCRDSDRVSLVIADNGVGFDPETSNTSGLGVLTMRERAEFVGGSFSLEAKPGAGTRVEVTI